MASKHFPQDFFNNKQKKNVNQIIQATNDETLQTSHENDGFSNFYGEKSINDYVMKTSLTIEYDRQEPPNEEPGADHLNSFTMKQENFNQSTSIETFSDIVSK